MCVYSASLIQSIILYNKHKSITKENKERKGKRRRWEGRRGKEWEGRGKRGGREDERKGRKKRTKLITAGICLCVSPKHKTRKPQNKIKQNKNSRLLSRMWEEVLATCKKDKEAVSVIREGQLIISKRR